MGCSTGFTKSSGGLEHGKLAPRWSHWKGTINFQHFFIGESEISGASVLRRMFRVGRFRYSEEEIATHEESQSYLPRRRVVCFRDLFQHATTPCVRAGKMTVTEWAVSHDRDSVA